MCSWRTLSNADIFRLMTKALFCALLLVSASSSAKVVTARGISEVSDDNIVEARRIALESAKREAVEQAVGTFIRARTDVNNYLLAKDEIFSTTAGQIDQFDIEKDGLTDNGVYEIVIRADVRVNAMLEQVKQIQKAYGWIKKPRVTVTINSASNNTAVAQNVKTQMHRRLSREGFDVFDSDELVHAGFVVDLLVSTQTKTDSYQGIVLTANDLSVSFNVTRVGDEQVLASAHESDSKPGIKTGEIYAKLSNQLVSKAWPNLRNQTIEFWQQEQLRARNLVLEVQGVDSGAQAEKIRLALLEAVPAAQSSQLVQLEGGKATFTIEYKGWVEQMYEVLSASQFNYQSNVTLTGVSGNKITAKLG